MRQLEAERVAPIAAIIFDLGGTLVDWPDWDTAAEDRWAEAFQYYRERFPSDPSDLRSFVQAMRRAELDHWRRVEEQHWSGPPDTLVRDGFALLGRAPKEGEILAVLDGYAGAVSGWAEVYPDSRSTLQALRAAGYRLALLSNTWWAAAWHNADLAAHGLEDLLDTVVYTSDLPHSKPHPFVFEVVTTRLGVPPESCLMVGDRPIDDISGALGAGMHAVFKANKNPRPVPVGVHPTATIENLAELIPLLDRLKFRLNR